MTEQSNTAAATRAAYNAATTTLRNNNRDEFNKYMLEETAKRGLEWQPRLSPAEKARQDIARLAKEHGISLAFQVETGEDAQDNVEIRQAAASVAAEGADTERIEVKSILVEDEPSEDGSPVVSPEAARIIEALKSDAVQSQVTTF